MDTEQPILTRDEPPRSDGLGLADLSAAQRRWLEMRRQKNSGSVRSPAIPHQAGRAEFPLSFAQERMWFLHHFSPDSPLYNRPAYFRLRGPLNLAALEAGWNAVRRRHEVLRAVIRLEDGMPVQVIRPDHPKRLEVLNLDHLPESIRADRLIKVASDEARQGFDLTADLHRCRLLRLAPDDHVLLLTFHHAVFDGWSAGLLLDDLAAAYRAACEHQPPAWRELPIQYGDYACWQRQALQSELDRDLAWWRQKLAGCSDTLNLPTDRPSPAVRTGAGGNLIRRLSPSLTAGLKRQCREDDVTLFMALLAAWVALLYRYSGNEEILVGVPVAGRTQPDTESLIGCFINTLALRHDLSGNPTVRELLGRVKTTSLEAFSHQQLPFEKLVEALQVRRDLSRTPLYQVLFQLRNTPKPTATWPGLQVEPLAVNTATAKTDLQLDVLDEPSGLLVDCEYSTDLFEPATIQRILDHYENVLAGLVADPAARLDELPMLTESERLILPDPRKPLAVQWPDNVVSRFERHVQTEPQQTAVIDSTGSWTYAELDQRSRQVANALLKQGLQRGDLVAVLAGRNKFLPATLLGIWRAGGAFLILDERQPAERLVERCRAALPKAWISVVAEDQVPPALRDYFLATPPLRGGLSALTLTEPAADFRPPVPVGPEELAYVVFTSGSSGQPKGILGAHGPIAHFLAWHTAQFGLGREDRFSALSGLGHDPLLRDLFAPLWVGSTLCLPPADFLETGGLAQWLREAGITVSHLTPGLAQVLVDSQSHFPALRQLCLGGDVLRGSLARQLRECAPAARIIHCYGTTETPQAVAWQEVAAGADLPETISIGQGIEAVQLLVLNGSGTLAAMGELGEIVVRTPCLAIGYLNDPELTKQCFITNPATGEPTDRIYRTGDFGRYLPDGTVQLIGRRDHQVKLRGHRIELGEIEAALRSCAEVREAAVVLRENPTGEKSLTAHVVLTRGSDQTPAALLEQLRRRLPDHLVPASLALADRLPLTPNGKLDRRALAAIALEKPTIRQPALEPPQSLLELELIRLWQQLFHREEIGRQDNFFDLGGHSLMAMRLVAKMEKLLGHTIEIASLFQAPTVAALAQMLTNQEWLPPWHSLVPLQSRGTRPPFYYIHGWGGTVFGFLDIARQLAPDQPVYGLQAVGLDGRTTHHGTIAEMAAHYVAEITSFQPQGPYYVGGYSLGGMMAFEVAQQLRAAGHEVGLLALFDTRPKNLPWPVFLRTQLPLVAHRTRFHLRQMLTDRRNLQWAYLKARLQAMRILVRTRQPAPPWTPAATKDAIRPSEGRDYFAVAGSHYQARPYHGPAALFITQDMHPSTLAAWRCLIPGRLAVVPVPGTHGNLLEPANAAELVLAFKHHLWAAQSNLPQPAPGGATDPRVLAREVTEIEPHPKSPTPIGHQLNCPASFAQQRMWFLHHFAPGVPVYNLPMAYRLAGTLDLQALERALEALIHRHESLRTTFALQAGKVMQRIAVPGPFQFPTEFLTSRFDGVGLAERLTTDAREPFDLETGPLFRARLHPLNDGGHVLSLVVHHSIFDGWSLGVLARELGTLYAGFAQGAAVHLADLPIQYADFAGWQNGRLQGDTLERLLDFWRNNLAGAPTALDLTADRPRPPVESFRGGQLTWRLPQSVSEQLESLARQEEVSLFMLLMAAFQTLLSRYTGQEDLVVGTPMAGRSRPETEGLVGFFINTLPLRADLFGNPSFRELLHRVKSAALAAYAHQEVPFEKLVDHLKLKRDTSRSPLFQVLFALQNLGDRSLVLPGLNAEPLEVHTATCPFDLAWYVYPEPGGLRCRIEFSADLFDPDRIERMTEHFAVLLKGILANPAARLSEFPLMTVSERQRVLVEWNDTATDYPKDKCVHQLFEEQVERTPEAVAVVFDGQQLSYRQLNNRASELAEHLRNLGVGPEVLTGIFLERSLEMIVGVLAILKAGGAYVPLDPALPAERLRNMMEDARLSVVVSESKLVATLPPHHAQVVLTNAPLAESSTAPVPSAIRPEHLAYVLFTSGSTGRPKGVQIPHRAVVNFLSAMRQQTGMTERDVLLAVTTLSFDIAGLELFLPLTTGARVVLASQAAVADGKQLVDLMTKSQPTLMQATPITWRMFLEAGWTGSRALKILIGGEAFSRELANTLASKAALVWNMYGPTETTIWSTTLLMTSGDGPVRIGRPIANTQAYIVDPCGRLVPLGIPGELWLGGAGVGRGYLNRPELTAERFVRNPFSDDREAKVYRTGDRCRWTRDGELEFLGRLDDQVKLRGYRIELGEIEAALQSCAEVREAAVVLREDPAGEKSLAAFVVLHHESAESPATLRDHLRRKLPDYMIPATFTVLAKLPLTPSGKVDRKTLGNQAVVCSPTIAEDLPLRNETESTLAQIWAQVLQLDRVGIRDDFFLAGGHSLLAARLAAILEERFKRQVPFHVLFQHATVEQMAQWLLKSNPATKQDQGLRGTGDGIPIFHVPGMAGVEFLPAGVAAEIGKMCRFFDGFRYPGLSDHQEPASRIEDIAASLIPQLNQVYPQGPLRISGFSMGGTVAFELARQLHLSGRPVEAVLLIDTFICGAVQKRTTPQALAALWRHFTTLAPNARAAFLYQMVANKLRWLRRRPAVQSEIQADNIPGLQGKDPSSPEARVLRAAHRAWIKYRPAPYEGRVVLFKPDAPPPDKGFFHPVDPLNGWNEAARRGVEVVVYPGDHTTFLYEPGSSRLGFLIAHRDNR